MHKLAEKIADCMKAKIEAKGIDNIEGQDLIELSMWSDIIKDLVCYDKDKKILEAMDESEYGEDYDENGPMEERRYYRGQPRDSRGRYMSRRGRRGYAEPYYHMTPEMYKEHGPEYWRDMDRHEGRMYYTVGGSQSGSSGMSGGNMGGNSSSGGTRNYGGESGRIESRSETARRGYIETKELRPGNSPEDKQMKAKELEKYMNELAGDISSMLTGASNEEKTLAKTKLQTLVQKI